MTIDFSRLPEVVNRIYYRYLLDYRRYQIFKGGAGAGKSVFITQRLIYNIITVEGYNVLALRKVGRDNHNSTFAELLKCIHAWNLNDLFEVNHSYGNEEIRCKFNGNKIIFRGLDNVEKIKSITFTAGDLMCIWVEEASEINEEDFNQLDLRIRGISTIPKHIILSLNPIDIDSFIKARFFDRPLVMHDGFVCETTYKDNIYLDQKYKETLENFKNIDEYYYAVYVLNQWGVRSSATVFHNLVIEDFEFKEMDFVNRRFGMDFGFNHANALEGIGYKDGELYFWWEAYAKHQLNAAFIRSVDETDLPKQYTIKADSAEPDKIMEWQNAGYDHCFPTEKFPGSVKRAVDYLKALPKIHIHRTLCPNAAREFPRFRYRQLKDGRVLDNEFVELDDDTVAAVRYAVDDLVTDAEQSHYFIKRRR